MKLYTSKEQTELLVEIGFPKPVGIGYNYSIGELIAFLEANTDISIWYDGKSGYWYVDYDLRRVGLDEYLINALYFACKKLKEEKSI